MPWGPWFMLAPTMDADRIATLLEPFLGGDSLSPGLAGDLQAYLDLLLRWNARMNLTSIRDPEQIITRHFGESLFAARVLDDAGALASMSGLPLSLADVGAGAGFPGIPIKLAVPAIHLTLIESQNKKATFLREVIRTLAIPDAAVFWGRAEGWQHSADIVTLRAAERFENAVEAAATLVAAGGRLCLLIGARQAPVAVEWLGALWQFTPPIPIPMADGRVVLVGGRVIH